MNARHAAALALVSWYLILPPQTAKNHLGDPAAPLSKWENGGASLPTFNVKSL